MRTSKWVEWWGNKPGEAELRADWAQHVTLNNFYLTLKEMKS
jgi:hypothetical protein